MKLFLDIMSQFLVEKRNFYKKKARAFSVIAVVMWPSGIFTGYVFFRFGFMRPVLLGAVGVLFAAALTTVLAKENYVKAGVYDQINEDLNIIRKRANERVEKDAAGGMPA